MRDRYEACEDLANHLVDHARTLLFQLGVTEDDVLERCLRGLDTPESGVSGPEARWVVHRLAELLGWPFLPDPARTGRGGLSPKREARVTETREDHGLNSPGAPSCRCCST